MNNIGVYSKQSYILRDTLDKSKLLSLKLKGWFVAGGACRSVFTGEKINDLDIFFETERDYNVFREKLDRMYGCVFETDSACSYNIEGNRVQLIKRVFGHPGKILDIFDFSIVQCAYYPETDKFIMFDNFLYDNAQRKLRYNIDIPEGESFPISSMIRTMKYVKKGYVFSGVEAVKLALTINNLKIETYKDLKVQLDGIDTLLFKSLTDSLLEHSGEKYEFNKFLVLAEAKLAEIWDNEE